MSNKAMSNETDLDWLARTEHHWPKDAVYVSRHENAVEWHYVELSFKGSGHFTHDQWLSRRAELQNKPGWKASPEWAGWIAKDSPDKDGESAWWWYADKPVDMKNTWQVSTEGRAMMASSCHCDLGDWRDTLERRPADLSEPAVTQRLDEATQNVLAAVPNLMGEKFNFEHNTKPVTVTNETVPMDKPVAVASTGDAGSANAWRSLHEWIKDEANNPQMALMEQVSSDLHNDGCSSAWVHLSRFIEALFERIDDLEDMTSGITDRQHGQLKPDSDWFERGELPPVGAECEALFPTTRWNKVKFMGIGYHESAIIHWEKGPAEVIPASTKFRPIRTEREVAIDEMKQACPYHGSWDSVGRIYAEALYDAGYRKDPK